jgi:hypothetical protein
MPAGLATMHRHERGGEQAQQPVHLLFKNFLKPQKRVLRV